MRILTSKEEILEWMSRDVRTRFMDRFDEILKLDTNPEEKFNLVLQNHVKSIFENVKLYDVFMTNVYRLKVDFKNQNMYLTKIEKYIEDIHKTIEDCFISLGITDAEKLLFEENTSRLCLGVNEEKFEKRMVFHNTMKKCKFD